MKKFFLLFFCICLMAACDLQPKISALPDTVGDFISERYPALLAEPDTEIYNSAAIDYGVYASPDIYGTNDVDDYINYTNLSDYDMSNTSDGVPVDIYTKFDDGVSGEEVKMSDINIVDDSEIVKDVVVESEQQTIDNLIVPGYKSAVYLMEYTKEPMDDVVVKHGDTLYKIAKENNSSVSDLAKINNLSEPYVLFVGQKIKLRGEITEKTIEKLSEKKIDIQSNEEITKKIKPEKQTEKMVAQTHEKKPESQPTSQPVIVVPEKKQIVKSESTVKQDDKTRVELDYIVVKSGDTLYSLSREYLIPVNDLAVLNNIRPPFALSVGQKIKVPKLNKVVEEKNVVKKADNEKNHSNNTVEQKNEKTIVTTKQSVQKTENKNFENIIVVKSGDTLYSLANKYSVSQNDLIKLNGMRSPYKLVVGQKIKIPVAKNKDVEKKSEIIVKQTESKNVQEKQIENKQKDKTVKNVAKNDTKKSEPIKKTEKTDKKTVQKQSVKNETKTVASKKDTTEKKQVKKVEQTKSEPKIASRSSSKFSWPVRGTILSYFGVKDNGLVNDGINIKSTIGTNVLASENGVVAYAGNEIKGMGNLIIIQHSDGWMTVYAHLNNILVKRGDVVKVGQKIGQVGQTGKVKEPQLHFEIRKGTKAYNPVTYLKK